jgi:hypothetical protein
VIISRASTSSAFGISFGVSRVIVPGADEEILEKVVQVVGENGAAFGKLQVGDVLHAINGVSTTHLRVDEVSSKLIRPALTLKCVVGRAVVGRDVVDAGCIPVTVTRIGLSDSFGFGMGSLSGGRHVITEVKEHTPAAGILRGGDEVVIANGIRITGQTHVEVRAVFLRFSFRFFSSFFLQSSLVAGMEAGRWSLRYDSLHILLLWLVVSHSNDFFHR